jgi:hypothetical protein
MPRSILGRLTDRRPRLAAAIGLGFWIGAVTVLILHANHIGSLAAFVFSDAWLIGAGSIGVPVLGLNFLGPRLSVRALELIAAACFVAAILVTVFVWAGQLRMDTWAAAFIFIMPLALGVQALNGAYGLDWREKIARQVRAEERAKAAAALAEAKQERDAAVEDTYVGALAQAFHAQHARDGELRSILSSDTEDLSAVCAMLREELAGRDARRAANGHNGTAKILRLVAGDRRFKATGTDPE